MKLLKTYLKPFAALVLACILLLFGQAMCDLTLPNLMSDIVNTGIQLGGVDEAAPAVLNQQAVDLLTLFMNDAEAGTFKNAYTPVEHGSDEETKLAKTYANIKDIDAVALSEDADVQAVGDAYGKAAYAFMTFLKDYGAQTGQAVDTESGVQDMDMRQLYAVIPMLQQMPKETFSEAIDSAENAQSMIGSQVGATFTKLFYKELGVDLDAKQMHYIVIKGLEMLGIALLGVLAAVLVGFFASRISSGVAKQMRSDVFRKVESFSNTEFDKFSTASLITRTTNDVTQVQMLISMGLRLMCYAPIMGVGGIIFALQKSVSLSWIIALAVIVLLGLVVVLLNVAMPKFKSLQRLTDRLNLVSRENLSGMLVVRAFTNEKFEEARFDKANEDLTRTNRFTQRVMSVTMPIMMLIMNLVTLLIMWVGGHAIAESTMQVGDMMAYIQYTMQIIMSFLMIACNRSGKSGTSGEPTATAVITRKGGKYRFFLLIYFYFEFYTGHAKKQSHKDADDSDTSRSNQNSCYTHLCYSFLDQTGESAESNCHQSRCQQHHGHSLERFRHLIVFHFFTQSSQDHDGNGKTKGCSKSVYNTGQNTVFLLYIGNRYT